MKLNHDRTRLIHSASGSGPIWRAALWAVLLVFVTAGYFQNSRPGWNVNSQFALTLAIAQRGTLRIDDYHEKSGLETGDKALIGGHYYSDKSPVTAFLGVPGYLLFRGLTQLGILEFSIKGARYWATWWTSGLAAALLAGLIVVALIRRGLPPARAARAGALWIAATPLLGYSILFYNYLPACALALGGTLLVEHCWRRSAPCSPWRVLLGGLLIGLAAWTLNTLALVALALSVALFCLGISLGLKEMLRRLTPWAVGGVLGISGYFIYNHAVSGSFSSLYRYEVDPFFREQMTHGLMGATQPRALVAWLVTVHPFQGLFLWFPLVTLAFAGLLRMLIRLGNFSLSSGSCTDASIALFVFCGLLLYTSAYFMWWGGWAYAPRHLIPALPFIALGLAPWLMNRHRWVKRFVFTIGGLGALLNLAVVALDPQPPPGLAQDALLNPASVFHLLPHGWSEAGPFPMMQRYFWLGNTDTNWGTALGLHGPASLILLLVIWVVMGWLAGRWINSGTFNQPSPTNTESPHAPAQVD